jgi:hypothetical protein
MHQAPSMLLNRTTEPQSPRRLTLSASILRISPVTWTPALDGTENPLVSPFSLAATMAMMYKTSKDAMDFIENGQANFLL